MNIPIRRTSSAPSAGELDLYEAVALASNELHAAADSIYAAFLFGAKPTDNIIASARAACARAIAVLETT